MTEQERPEEIEATVRHCYSTWSRTYFNDYYGANSAYPPVHIDIVRQLLHEAKAENVLDAGCGPASMLRLLDGLNIERFGFDLTPEMVKEAQVVMQAQGVSANHIWEGSVLSPHAFQIPGIEPPMLFDAAICIGVFPHIAEADDVTVIENLKMAVKTNGLVVIEARNGLFSLFTQNRYTYQFITEELIQLKKLEEAAGKDLPVLTNIMRDFEKHFRMDIPPVRKGTAGEPGYDEVLSRTHIPFVLKQQFADAGFNDVQLLFYHYHVLPPMFGKAVPELFQTGSVAMENPLDWRGYFMASAFLLAGKRR